MEIFNYSVSVIIPSFNQGYFLPETVKSVLSQTFKDYEIIIVDDASDDGFSTNVALSLASNNIRVFVNKTNLGVCATRNYAISKSRSKYILPLDADDKIGDTYLEKSVNILNSGIADVVYCQARFFGAINENWELPDFTIERMLYGNIVFNCALFKRSDFFEVGCYSDLFRPGYEDWDLWLSFLEKNKIFYKINEQLFFYRQHEISRNSNAIDRHDLLAKLIYEKHRELYLSFGIKSFPSLSCLKKYSKKNSRMKQYIQKKYKKLSRYITLKFQ